VNNKDKKNKGDVNPELSDAGKTLGHFGGLHGGPARDKALSHAEKVKIAKEGAAAKHAKDQARIHTVKKKLTKKKKKGDK
jgi:hypothetical protein